MTAVARVKGDREPVICGVCRRRATTGLGWAGKQGHPVLWLCDSPGCGQVARSVYEMPTIQLDEYERRARDAAGERAGAFLDGIGKTDLATLAPEEWAAFLQQIIVGFEDELRRMLLGRTAPF